MDDIPVSELLKSHLIELLIELKELADSFVLIGGQALPYITRNPRTTKDVDFMLDVLALREADKSIAEVLSKLNYQPVEASRNFQFQKEINPELKIRIDFLASEKEQRKNNIRVDIQDNIHARGCTGAEIAIKESDNEHLSGFLPDGKPAEVIIRVVRAHALLMLKLFAMDDKYRNIRGPKEAEHDRNEARIHSADIAKIVNEHINNPNFAKSFWLQFDTETELRNRAKDIFANYFANIDSPGIILYAEFLKMQNIEFVDEERNRVIREIGYLLRAEVNKSGASKDGKE